LVERVVPEVPSTADTTTKHLLILSNSGADNPIAISKDKSLPLHPIVLHTVPGALHIIPKLMT
jgi:hypothetical protein